jgi:hypothetical protein
VVEMVRFSLCHQQHCLPTRALQLQGTPALPPA